MELARLWRARVYVSLSSRLLTELARTGESVKSGKVLLIEELTTH